MDIENFLARVTPPGNYICVSTNTKPGTSAKDGFGKRFFTYPDFAGAAGYMRWAVKRKFDVYHSNASFLVADTSGIDKRGNPKFTGQRTLANVQAVRCFWIDLDVARQGDGKDPNATYTDQRAAVTWLLAFCQMHALPRFNMLVSSGYGVHAYWVLQDPMTTLEWLPYAGAFKAMMVLSGFKGDVGVSGDAARILRPPETFNHKTAIPAPVSVIASSVRGEIPNLTFLSKLDTHVATAAAAQTAVRSSTAVMASGANSAAALAGAHNVTSIFAGQSLPNMAAAAQANTPRRQAQPRFFSEILLRCGQAATSIKEHGANDGRQMWHNLLTLLHFCDDGAQYAHPIGDAHPSYSVAATDAEVTLIEGEHIKHGFGPISCSTFEHSGRANVCQACPLRSKINNPWQLGLKQSDLPPGYRRWNNNLQAMVVRDKEEFWFDLIPGDITEPILDIRPSGGHDFSFTYEAHGSKHAVQIVETDLPNDPGSLHALFSRQFLSIPHGNEARFRGFIVAYMTQLRAAKLVRTDKINPFGWATDAHNAPIGFAVGGLLYKADGTTTPAPGGDQQIVSSFTETGTLAVWKKAAAYVIQGRIDQQAIIGAAFASPLMRLAHYRGVIISEWSRESAIGKSSGLNVAQAVWGKPSFNHKLNDTPNAVMHKIASTKAMPAFWDEARVKPEDEADFINGMFQLTQGVEKARLNSSVNLRTVGEWETVMVLASNKPVMDMIMSGNQGTDAGAVRCFEWEMSRPKVAQDPNAQKIIAAVETNYGSAGRVFAAWLAANHAKAQALVDKNNIAVSTDLGAETSERLYVATITVLLSGAQIAKALGLVAFDLNGLRDFLYATFHELRRVRKRDVVVSSSGYDLQQVLADYMSTMMGRRIVTDRFAKRGPANKVNIVWYPQNNQHVDIQVGQQDKLMRINRAEFVFWARKKGYSGSDLIASMEARWKAVVHRAVIGAGAGAFGGGYIHCIDLDLTHLELEPYQFQHLTSQNTPATGMTGGPPAGHPAQQTPAPLAAAGVP